MEFKNRIVSIKDIDLKNYFFRITSKNNFNDIVRSIDRIGLINTPILLEEKSKFTVLSGFRRIYALIELGKSYIEARVFDLTTDRDICIKIAILDNSIQRELDILEKSRAINLVSLLSNKYENISNILLDLGVNIEESIIEKIKQVLNFPQNIIESILSYTIPLVMAIELNKLKIEQSDVFIKLFNELKPSLNKQREIINFFKEISLREDISILEIFKSSEVRYIIENTDYDKNQKIKKLRQYLRKRRFPSLTKAVNRFEENIKMLKMPEQIKLLPPPDFEGNIFTINLSFKNLNELTKNIEQLKKIIQNSIFENLINFNNF